MRIGWSAERGDVGWKNEARETKKTMECRWFVLVARLDVVA